MKRIVAVLFTAVFLMGMALGQEQKSQESSPEPAARQEPLGTVYRLLVTINEMEGETKINTRAYTVMVRPRGATGSNGQLRVGSRVPIQTGKDSVQYMDVGTKIDIYSTRESEGVVMGSLSIEMNTVAPGELQGGGNPVLRDLRLSAPFYILAPGKPTIVGTVDDVNSKRTFQVEVTATKLR